MSTISGNAEQGAAPAGPGTPEQSTASRIRRVLAIPAFRKLWGVTFLCSTADWLALLGVASLVANATDNYTVKTFAFSGVVLSNIVPGLLFAPIGGLLADRFDRRAIMVVADVLRCALLLSVVLVDLPWWPFLGTFLVSSTAMLWIPAKDASVPNLLRGREQIETASQLGLVMTYGIAVVAGGGLYALTGIGPSLGVPDDVLGANGTIKLAIGMAAALYLLSALTIAKRIPELSRRDRSAAPVADEVSPGLGAMVRDIGLFIRTTPVVRGLMIGAFGAFAAGGAVIGSAQPYATSLLAGQAGFGLLFAAVFVGLTIGMVGAPKFARRLAHERLFGTSIVLAGLAMTVTALSPHLFVSLLAVVAVGACAGTAFLTGVTIIGSRVGDDVRGRVNAIYQALMKVVLGSALAVVPILVGLVQPQRRKVFGNEIIIDGTRPVLLGAAVLACLTGVLAYRQMDDRRPEPILADLRNALRRHPRRVGGVLVNVEGTATADVARHTARLAEWLDEADTRPVVVAADPSVMQVASLAGPRARVLAAAAIRADIVERHIRPALDTGAIAVVERMIDATVKQDATSAELDADELTVIADWATGHLRPDITILLDHAPETTEALPTPANEHWRIRQLLADMAGTHGSRYVVVEDDGDFPATQARIQAAVTSSLPLLPRDR